MKKSTNFSIVPPHLAVKSMRDNGYRNTAYAIAELIDNSIQHGASNVELICLEKDQFISSKTVSRIDQVAILDNGSGMNSDVLRMALQFGNGTNLDAQNPETIGKFGMGLPSSSISQAKRVDVYTWQHGIENAIYCYLDLDEIISGDMDEVPVPLKQKVPSLWKQVIGKTGQTGTLVIWSELDRCLWRTGKTIIDHSEFVVGRMYRKFINSGQSRINATVYKENSYGNPILEQEFLANDPLYLMENTSVSELLIEEGLPDPMFVKYGGQDGFEKTYAVNYKGKNSKVHVRYSIASELVRKGVSPGSRKHGKHAKDNVGVSVMRAGRELDLDRSWVNTYDPRERWWGVEVDFPPALDEVFGVTNNKQYAVHFKEMGELDIDRELKERQQTIQEYKDELRDDNDPKVYLLEIAIDIKNQLNQIRNTIKAQASRLEENDDMNQRFPEQGSNTPELVATRITETRIAEGHTGASDKSGKNKSVKQNIDAIATELAEDSIPDADELGKELFESPSKFQFVTASLQTRAFFTVSPIGGKIIIKINTTHPAYDQFVEILSGPISADTDKPELIKRLRKAKDGLKLLLMAWARFEDEQPDGRLKDGVQDTRVDWGRMAADFMRE
jgi:hypothetical protein